VTLPWRWFAVLGEEPYWLGELRRVLAAVSDALPSVDTHQKAWPSVDWGEHPDPRASHRHWLVEQPQLRAARQALERLDFKLEGDPHSPGLED